MLWRIRLRPIAALLRTAQLNLLTEIFQKLLSMGFLWHGVSEPRKHQQLTQMDAWIHKL
jgi:hypothetical protein